MSSFKEFLTHSIIAYIVFLVLQNYSPDIGLLPITSLILKTSILLGLIITFFYFLIQGRTFIKKI